MMLDSVMSTNPKHSIHITYVVRPNVYRNETDGHAPVLV